MKTISVALFMVGFLVSVVVPLVQAVETAPVVSKTAPRLDSLNPERPESGFKDGAQETAALPMTDSPRSSTDTIESMSQNIEVGARDEVPVVLDPPSVNLPFKEVVGFSRPGQTEKVLLGPMDHMPGNEILNLSVLDARQALSPLPVRIPQPPFIRMEIPAGYASSNWSFRVEGPMERIVYQVGGLILPQDLVVWDGFKEGEMVLLAGEVYLPVLSLTDGRGIPQQYFGYPIQLDVLQYDRAGVRHVEFKNDVLFQRDSAELSMEVVPLVNALLNRMRRHVGSPYKITVFEDDGGGELALKRVKTLKRFFEDALLLEADAFLFWAEPPASRGAITSVQITLPAGEEL
jgi:hypothetical protein